MVIDVVITTVGLSVPVRGKRFVAVCKLVIGYQYEGVASARAPNKSIVAAEPIAVSSK